MAGKGSLSRLALPFLAAATLLAGDAGLPAGANRFAIAAYGELADGGNLIFSPFNISTALSMTLGGARGQTAAEIARVLGQAQAGPAYHAALAALADQLAKQSNTGGNELLAANSLWVQHGFKIESDFKQLLQTVYRAPLAEVDFLANPDQARADINGWTGQRTKGKIQELFGPGSLDTSTRLVLTSAIYFYGKWQAPFHPQETRAAPFRPRARSAIDAPFMHQTAPFLYTETAAAQILEMKYAGTGLAFDVLLPKTEQGLADLERSLNSEAVGQWLAGLKSRSVEVALPKFRATSSFSLRQVLSKMGMPSAFSDAADFSGIDDRRDLALSDVKHKAFVDVTEEGTEAAAATGAAVRLVSMPVQRPVVFRADHPFAFLIRDTRSGVILFAGRVADPTR